MEGLSAVASVMAIVGGALALVALWKGSPAMRFGVAWMVLTYLPYTAWDGSFAQAYRYLYLPSVGGSIAIGLAIVNIQTWGSMLWGPRAAHLTGVAVGMVVIANALVTQTWIRRNAENGIVRESFITALGNSTGILEAGNQVYIEVPAEKYVDLRQSCRFVSAAPVQCRVIRAGGRLPVDPRDPALDGRVYWLRVSPRGFDQVYPPTAELPTLVPRAPGGVT